MTGLARCGVLGGFLLAGLLKTATARADPWDEISTVLASTAKVRVRTDNRIEIEVPGLAHHMTVTRGPQPGADIWFELRHRRGRNPYRAWYIRRAFVRNPPLPKKEWTRFFRIEFLRLLRVRD